MTARERADLILEVYSEFFSEQYSFDEISPDFIEGQILEAVKEERAEAMELALEVMSLKAALKMAIKSNTYHAALVDEAVKIIQSVYDYRTEDGETIFGTVDYYGFENWLEKARREEEQE